MTHGLDEIDRVAVGGFDSRGVLGSPALVPFAPPVVGFLTAVSKALLRDPDVRAYPDVATFAFWCRPASLEGMRRRHELTHRLGRGLVFHIAPGNVPVNFAYSLAAGLLAGNANVVRLPSSPFDQVDLIVNAMREATDGEHPRIRDYIHLVRYDRSRRDVTDELSRRCDVRVIWGGDETIAEIRRSPLSARAYDITFADRYSLCLIDAGAYLSAGDPGAIATDFYNDTYLFDQNACTAPHLVLWTGSDEQVAAARSRFWEALHTHLSGRYHLPAVSAVDKLTVAYRFAASGERVQIPWDTDNLIVRSEVPELGPGIEQFRSSCGFFIEHHLRRLEDIVALVTRSFQTLSYLGFDGDELADLVVRNGLAGIDRIVPIGRTLDFDLDWDGYRLIEALGRVVVAI